MKTVIVYAATGLAAGFLNGLFGTGGALPILALFTAYRLDSKTAFASANLCVVVLSCASFLFYLKSGALDTSFLSRFFPSVFIPALIGGALGSLILSKVSPVLLKRIFFIIIAVGGIGTVLK